MSIQILPDLCLLKVFDGFDQAELRPIHLTCSRWFHLRDSIYARRRSVSLMIVDELTDTYGLQDVIILDQMSDFTVNRLVKVFPNIVNLKLSIKRRPSDETIAALATLMSRWSKKVVTLKYESLVITLPVVELFNQLYALRQLSLKLYDPHFEMASLQFPLMARLHKLSFSFSYLLEMDKLCQWLGTNWKEHSNPDLLIDIFIPNSPLNDHLDVDKLEAIYQSGAPLNRFVGQFPSPISADFRQLRRFTELFTRLETLSLFCNLSLPEIGKCLASLYNLKILTLKISKFDNPFEEDVEEQNVNSLTTVRKLIIEMDGDVEPARIHPSLVGHFFPNLDEVFLNLGIVSASVEHEYQKLTQTFAEAFNSQCYKKPEIIPTLLVFNFSDQDSSFSDSDYSDDGF